MFVLSHILNTLTPPLFFFQIQAAAGLILKKSHKMSLYVAVFDIIKGSPKQIYSLRDEGTGGQFRHNFALLIQYIHLDPSSFSFGDGDATYCHQRGFLGIAANQPRASYYIFCLSSYDEQVKLIRKAKWLPLEETRKPVNICSI